MNQLPSPLAGLFQRAVDWRFSGMTAIQASPAPAQERAYRRIRRRLLGTEVARRTGLLDAPDLRSFVARVPVHEYAFFRELVERAVDRGEPSVLFHGPPVFVALTSGTSGGEQKRIVSDRAALRTLDAFEFAMGINIMHHADFNPFLHHRLNWGTSAPPSRTAAGVEQGYISGFLAAHPRFGRSRTLPPPAISEIPDLDQKVRVAAPVLRARSIRLASSTPVYFLNLLEELRQLWGVEDLSRIWPDLLVVLYAATPVLPHRAQIQRVLGHPVRFMGMYLSTEGPLGYEIPSLNGDVNGLYCLHYGDIVFTFRKIDGDGRVLTVADLVPGDEVELMLTTPSGLLQYRIGDCLRIRGTRPLLFEIAGRAGQGLSVAGEKATLGQLAQAAARAGDLSPTPVRHFFVCPGSSGRERPCYAWTLVVDQPEVIDREAMGAALDRAMGAENDIYAEFRADLTLDAPRLDLLGAEVARRYFARDNHRGQLKMKTAFDTAELLRAFLAGLGVVPPGTLKMTLPATVLSGLCTGFVLSVPPGPAGVVILQRSLAGERRRAAAAVAAFLAAELLALLSALLFLEQVSWLAARPWMKAAAGAYLLTFAVTSFRTVGTERGLADTSTLGVFRLTLLNPALWIGAIATLTLARVTGGAGLLARALFVTSFEAGGLGWYLALILAARAVPVRLRHLVVRAALLVIGGTGLCLIAWFLAQWRSG